MDIYAATELPWLSSDVEQMRARFSRGRVPHAVLIVSADGLGAEALADWIAAAALCESSQPPCGQCAACVLAAADNHPDLYRVQREERAQQLKIEQVRDLIEVLGLTSFRGHGKVGIVFEADTLNIYSANAFLKTLEEPPAGTLLILVARPSHRLPATIASRCQRINVRVPEAGLAKRWLGARPGGEAKDHSCALSVANGAPLVAASISEEFARGLIDEVKNGLVQLERRTADPSLIASQWVHGDVRLRLACLENWITSGIRQFFDPDSAESKTVDSVVLSATLLKSKIRGLFRLLDELREVRRLMSTSANLQLAIESLLLRNFVPE